MTNRPLSIFALEGSRPFGERVAAHLAATLASHEERSFEDGEHKARPLQDVRGQFRSEGSFNPYLQEINDGHDTIEWLAAQPYVDGKVGTFGLSYPGAVQWMTAPTRPQHLVAMVPAMTFANARHFTMSTG